MDRYHLPTSVQLLIYRGWHTLATINNDVHDIALNKIVQKGIPKGKFINNTSFDVNLNESVQFFLNGPYTVIYENYS